MGRKNKKRKNKMKSIQAGGLPATIVEENAFETKKTFKDAHEFELRIPKLIFEKVMYWIDKASPNEVSGFGNLSFNEETREFTVTDAFLLEQKVSGGSAEIDEKSLNKTMFEQRNAEGALKWHWHSHPTFNVFWSGTDDALIKQLGRPGWIVASVFNCKRESRTAFLTSVDLMGKPHDIFIDDFPTKIISQPNAQLQMAYDREFDKNVKTSWSYNGGDYKSNYFRPNYDEAPWASKKNEKKSRADEHDYTNTIDIRKKSVEKIPITVWSKFGYADQDYDFIYNPCYDTALKGDHEIQLMIEEMKPNEIDFLRPRCAVFDKAVRDYLVDKARVQGVEM